MGVAEGLKGAEAQSTEYRVGGEDTATATMRTQGGQGKVEDEGEGGDGGGKEEVLMDLFT